MALIAKIQGREILDSRGWPTVEVSVTLDDGTSARASVPSGASTGSHEALELRDGDMARYQGKGVLKAIDHIQNLIQPALLGMDVLDQRSIDEKMIALDGTPEKSRLGANAILGVSLAVARAAAMSTGRELYQYLETLVTWDIANNRFPIPMFNVINGGEHADSGLSVQEFKIVPSGIASYPEQLRAGSEIFHALQRLLQADNYTTGVGDEGGFAPRLASHQEAFDYLVRAIRESGYLPGQDIQLDIDAAASSFYVRETDRYQLKPENRELDRSGLLALYAEWAIQFPLISIEDPLHEEDWDGWVEFTHGQGSHLMIIGDDLLVTNVTRLQQAIDRGACNAVLVKVNQIGTLSETFDCLALAKAHGMKTIISHRSGETGDDFIADLAVGARADYIKTGSLSRGERLAKYNRLLEIYTKQAGVK